MSEVQTETDTFVIMEVAETAYGVRSQFVRQLEMVEHITPVPNGTHSLEGVVFSRGQVIPAVNLRTRFGFMKTPFDLRTRLVVVKSGTRLVGLIADTAREFASIPPAAIQPAPDAIASVSGNYVEGIANINGRIVIVLNVEKLITSTRDESPAALEPASDNAALGNALG